MQKVPTPVVPIPEVNMEMPASFRRDKFRTAKGNKEYLDVGFFSFDDPVMKKEGQNFALKG